MRNGLLFGAAGLAAILGAGCASTDTVSGPSAAASPAASDGGASQSASATTWRLVSINGRPALEGVQVTASFAEDNRIAGSAGCNRYVGSAVVNGEAVRMSQMASTRMYCGSVAGVMDQEDEYLSTLAKATVYRVVGGELQLGPAPGTVTLVFKQ